MRWTPHAGPSSRHVRLLLLAALVSVPGCRPFAPPCADGLPCPHPPSDRTVRPPRGSTARSFRRLGILCAVSVQQRHGTDTGNDVGSTTTSVDKELFSVAPMMAHTNRHYRFFWRLFSSRTFLYTEMIPAAQIVNLYDRELANLSLSKRSSGSGRRDNRNSSGELIIDTDEIAEVVSRIKRSGHNGGGTGKGGTTGANPRGTVDPLNELLRRSGTGDDGHTALQIGGCDPVLLARASAIGAAFGYSSVNLNCGCPSNAVNGRGGGALLMREPMHVARCVESMNRAVTDLYHSSSSSSSVGSGSESGCAVTPITVKHRLGVRDAATYDAEDDRSKGDGEEAFPTCREFVTAVTFAGDVKKLQVHARLGLLGDFDAHATTTTTTTTDPSPSSIWVPGTTTATTTTNKSIDHKRAQYQAKRKSRRATIQNRSVPPLRPNVVDLLADEFPRLEFVANGGFASFAAVRDRIRDGPAGVVGAMAGRAAINHPCSFATADSLWGDGGGDGGGTTGSMGPLSSGEEGSTAPPPPLPSRGEILLRYITYCNHEESRVRAMGEINPSSLAALRRRLVAVPFHLFAGEDGSHSYQRRIRKLASRAERHSAGGMLTAAMNEVPVESVFGKSAGVCRVEEVGDLEVYEFSAERSGPLQKNIL